MCECDRWNGRKEGERRKVRESRVEGEGEGEWTILGHRLNGDGWMGRGRRERIL